MTQRFRLSFERVTFRCPALPTPAYTNVHLDDSLELKHLEITIIVPDQRQAIQVVDKTIKPQQLQVRLLSPFNSRTKNDKVTRYDKARCQASSLNPETLHKGVLPTKVLREILVTESDAINSAV